MAMGRDLAKKLGKGRTCADARPRLRGGRARACAARVYTAVYLELNAKLQMQAEAMGKKVKFLTKGEVNKVIDDHVAGQRQPRLGELVPRGGPAVPGVVALSTRVPDAMQRKRSAAVPSARLRATCCAAPGTRTYTGPKFGGGTRRFEAAS